MAGGCWASPGVASGCGDDGWLWPGVAWCRWLLASPVTGSSRASPSSAPARRDNSRSRPISPPTRPRSQPTSPGPSGQPTSPRCQRRSPQRARPAHRGAVTCGLATGCAAPDRPVLRVRRTAPRRTRSRAQRRLFVHLPSECRPRSAIRGRSQDQGPRSGVFTAAAAPDAWRHYLAMVLDGMRACPQDVTEPSTSRRWTTSSSTPEWRGGRTAFGRLRSNGPLPSEATTFPITACDAIS